MRVDPGLPGALVLALFLVVPGAPGSAADGIRGGRLYDTWWTIAGAPTPTGSHPLYPELGQQSGATTFRCKECHGWDYKGVDGAYGSGSHFTGIIGVLGSPRSPEEMAALIRNPDGDGSGGTTRNGHGFGTLGLTDSDIDDLIEFLRSRLIDGDAFLDAGARFLGDSERGRRNYTVFGGCFACHGEDGTAINFGQPEKPEWVGTVAVENPWEFMHKVRFGQPGSAPPMPSWLESGGIDQEVSDLGRYVQETFPTGSEPQGGRRVPGDCNQDRVLDIADAVCELQLLFFDALRGFPCASPGADPGGGIPLLDWEGDGGVDLTDVVALLQFLFNGGPPHALAEPGAPGACVLIPECPDPTRCD